MRHISIIAALAILIAAPSVAGSTQTQPGIGTFSYSGSPAVAPTPSIVIAGLTRADRS